MKKMVLILALLSAVLFAQSDIFSGDWYITDQGLKISFGTENSVTFESSEDESLSGEGNYSVEGDELTANIANSDMEMQLVWQYKGDATKLEVKTIKLNGDAVEAGDWVELVRAQ